MSVSRTVKWFNVLLNSLNSFKFGFGSFVMVAVYAKSGTSITHSYNTNYAQCYHSESLPSSHNFLVIPIFDLDDEKQDCKSPCTNSYLMHKFLLNPLFLSIRTGNGLSPKMAFSIRLTSPIVASA